MKNILIFVLALSLLAGCKQADQGQRTFLIPEGFTGWVTVHNEPAEGEGKREYNVTEEGHAEVKEKDIHDGWASNKYYYVDKEGKRKELSEGKMIHGASGGDENKGEAFFFVGNKEDFEKTEYTPEDK
ncbi:MULTISPECIES: DUF6843 domain-containing protein [Metabacillus]|uniref:DUF6843 domain-containing protein n=1 Tax=Metabacillus indicus TaxID=246786 RepID=A0A084H2Y5_METID|nr:MULTISPECIES: hypothetical protein [Metabacillus]KEZ52735.1 hypothetical protein AZ46_0203055 [Metabacillus indicus LMG 22858]KEZ53947.1 hypothetical protein GS18_0203165 [Metabacillus indicus]